MKTIKSLALLLTASLFALGVSAQSSTTKSSPSKPATQTTAPAGAKAAPGTKATPPANVPTTDKLDPTTKGPNGEKVYVGPKGGKYYLNSKGNKTYLKQTK